MKLCHTINTGWSSLLIRIAGHVVRLLAEHVVRAYLDKHAVCFLHCRGKVLRSISIQLLSESSQLLVRLTSVHICPCSTIYDCLYIVFLHHLADGVHVSNVKVSGLLTLHLIDIRENVMVRRISADDTHLIAKLTVGTGY